MRLNTNVTRWAQKYGLASDLISPGQHSPLLDAHPHGGVDVPVEQLLGPAVCESDDTASDILQRRIGGAGVADTYIHHLGIGAIRIADTERQSGRTSAPNTGTVRSQRQWSRSCAIGRLFAANSGTYSVAAALDDCDRDWSTPAEGVASSGHGGRPQDPYFRDGERDTNAANDAGLITLPDGRRLAVAVFITDSPEEEKNTREGVIARIVQAI